MKIFENGNECLLTYRNNRICQKNTLLAFFSKHKLTDKRLENYLGKECKIFNFFLKDNDHISKFLSSEIPLCEYFSKTSFFIPLFPEIYFLSDLVFTGKLDNKL